MASSWPAGIASSQISAVDPHDRLEPDGGARTRLHTRTSDENPAMQRVNADLGFRPAEQTHMYEWQG
jgi:RimJ/RimL family protein N-acetyltransferase